MARPPAFVSSTSDASIDLEKGSGSHAGPVAYAQPVLVPSSASSVYVSGAQPAAISNEVAPVLQFVDPVTGRVVIKGTEAAPIKFKAQTRWLWYVVSILIFTTTIMPIVSSMAVYLYFRSAETIPESVTKVLPWLQSDWDVYRNRQSFVGGFMSVLYTLLGIFTLCLVLFGIIAQTYRLNVNKVCSTTTTPLKRAMVFLVLWSVVWSIMSFLQLNASKSNILLQVIANFVLLAFGRVFSDWRISAAVGAGMRLVLTMIGMEIGMGIRKLSSHRELPVGTKNYSSIITALEMGKEMAAKVGFPRDQIYLSESVPSSHSRSLFQNDIVINYKRLSEKTEPQHYAGIIAHELGHWVNDDVVWLAATVAGIGAVLGALPFMLSALPDGVVELAACGLSTKAAVMIPDSASRMAVSIAMSDMIGTAFERIVKPAMLMESRRVEFRADRHAVEMGFGQGIYEALAMMAPAGNVTAPLATKVLDATHPPMDERLDAIRAEMETKGQQFTMPARAKVVDKESG